MPTMPELTWRQLLVGAGFAAVASQVGFSTAALAAGPKRKLIWVPQALGDWDTALQVGAKEFCEMAGWDYQRIGNPNYSVENHVEQVNNAIAAKPDIILTQLESPGLLPAFERGIDAGHHDGHRRPGRSRKRRRSSASTSSARTSSTPASSTATRPAPSPRS